MNVKKITERIKIITERIKTILFLFRYFIYAVFRTKVVFIGFGIADLEKGERKIYCADIKTEGNHRIENVPVLIPLDEKEQAFFIANQVTQVEGEYKPYVVFSFYTTNYIKIQKK